VIIAECESLPGEAVDVGRLDARVAKRPNRVVALVVGEQE